jgi:hypothetical protein
MRYETCSEKPSFTLPTSHLTIVQQSLQVPSGVRPRRLIFPSPLKLIFLHLFVEPTTATIWIPPETRWQLSGSCEPRSVLKVKLFMCKEALTAVDREVISIEVEDSS